MIAVILISAGIAYFLSMPFASLLQGANYRSKVYCSRAKNDMTLCVAFFLLSAIFAVLIIRFCEGILRGFLTTFLYGLSGLFTLWIHRRMRIPLTITNRLTRLLIATVALYIALFLPLYYLAVTPLWASCPALAPLVLLLAQCLVAPFERKNNLRYLKRAKEKLDASRAIKIGITGSYGKTSVKNDLEQLLSGRYRTLATPANFNTPLGIAKTMEQSNGEEEILVLEMGARRRGDIRALCELISPTIGVITGIAPQHLETFGSQEDVIAEKEELARAIPVGGKVYYNLADDLVRKMYEKRCGSKIGVGFEDADYLISDLRVMDSGMAFALKNGEDKWDFFLPLYGKASVVDFALACVVALDLGITAEELCEKAKYIAPAPHRFEVMRKGGVIVIDDSYNINPIGASAALESLSMFPATRRVVYVSGIVELGEQTERINRELGEKLAGICDLAIIADGKYGDLVVEGALRANPNLSIIRVTDTAEATAAFGQLLREGDVLLIMSDLPRDYLL